MRHANSDGQAVFGSVQEPCMGSPMTSFRFGDHSYLEIKDLMSAGWMAIVPTGCTEQQGPHLPVDHDTWFAETVAIHSARRASEQHGAQFLVLPALPFGPTPEHRSFGSGYVDIPHGMHEELVGSVLESLAEQGFSRIVVWRGCGEHRLQNAVQKFNLSRSPVCEAFLPELPYHDIWCRVADPNIPGGHADSFATSISLYLRPESVRLDQIPNADGAGVDWKDPNLDFGKYSGSGVIGDPTDASRDLGEALWGEIVPTVAEILHDIAEGKEH